MLVAPPNGRNLCLRCALRVRLLSLQQARLQSAHTSQHRRGHEKGREIKINYIFNKGDNRNTRPLLTPIHEGSVVRKEPNFRQWGLDPDSLDGKKETDFKAQLLESLKVIRDEVKNAPVLQQLRQQDEMVVRVKRDQGASRFKSGFQDFNRLWSDFKSMVMEADPDNVVPFQGKQVNRQTSLWDDLKLAWRTRRQRGLEDRIKYAFYGHVTNSRFTASDHRNQEMLADLRYPSEWYPATRALHRTIHLHVGPTNSGKTYHALQRLEQASSGVYAGPLRLLAHEVYSRLNAKGKPCALITGEERRMPTVDEVTETQDRLSACTVEMIPMNATLEVAVIDEIQMIGSAERGWAWTQALLGVKAKEVHLCGEERTVPLIRELCASIGEKLEIHRYQRLSPLKVADSSLRGDLKKLRKGDCIVSFSVMGIHALRSQIEKQTNRKVAIVYGSLPPETRAQQARLFNDPDNDYDFLVASDAVGMGLNLAIKRMIFESCSKFDGHSMKSLKVADIKQIAGRAGRFRTAAQVAETPVSEQALAAVKGEQGEESTPETSSTPSRGDASETTGLVTTLERFDYPIVCAAMEADPEPIVTAGLYPPAPILERFAGYFPPGTPFSYILMRLHEISQIHSRFHLCGLQDQLWVADLIEPVRNLTIADRNIICSAPASKTDAELWKNLMPAYARCIAEQSGGSLVDIQELPLETLEAEVSYSKEYLRALERLHKGIVGYLWLSYRFAGIFNTRGLAMHVKELVEKKIEDVLGKFNFSEAQRRALVKAREKKILDEWLEAAANDQGEPVGERATDPSAALVGPRDPDGEQDANEDEAAAEKGVAQLAGDGDAQEPNPERELERRVDLDAQTSSIMGGNRFGGEENIALEEPGIEDLDTEKSEATEEQHSAQAVSRLEHSGDGQEEFARDEEETPSKLNEAAADRGS